MSRVQFVRQMLPRICKDYYEIEFQYTGNASATFDPTLTTSVSTTIIWQPDDAPATVTTGTTHAFSYVPGGGSHRCKATVVGGLRLGIDLDVTTDALTRIVNISKMPLASITGSFNFAWVLALSEIRDAKAIYLHGGNAKIYGSLSDLNRAATLARLSDCPLVTGSLADAPSTLQYLHLFGDTLITAASIGHLTSSRELKLYSIGWDQPSMNTILDSMYAARAGFAYASPVLQILTGNAAPSGTYVAPPVDESENSDWAWDAGVGHHWPLTSNAKRWYLTHGPDRGTADSFHLWTIT